MSLLGWAAVTSERREVEMRDIFWVCLTVVFVAVLTHEQEFEALDAYLTRYDSAVLSGLKVAAVVAILTLGVWIWRQRSRR